MPDEFDDYGSGSSLRLPRLSLSQAFAAPKQDTDVQRFVQRPIAAFSPPDPFNALLPTPGEVRSEVTQQRRDKPWYEDAFEFIDQLTFGAAIRGFLKGLGEPEPGAAIKGFFRNLPGVYYATGEEVMTADIREAWGDTNARDGVKDAIFNTLGDVLSNPFMLFGSPLAVTKAGMAAAKAAGVSRYLKAGRGAENILASAEEMAQGLVSIGKGLQTGQRAMYTFNMFGKELFSLGKIPQGVNPLGFRSMYVHIGNMMDSFFSALHSHPLLKPVSGVFTFATGISDPLKRSLFGGATRAAEQTRNATMRSLTQIMEGSMTDKVRNFIVTDSGGHDAFLTAAQIGIDRMDLGAAFAHALDNSHLWMGRGRVQALLKKDPHFVALWTKAWEEVAQPAGMSSPAIRELYDKFAVPLDPQMLSHAGLEARGGIEKAIYEELTFAEKAAGAMGTGVTPEAARSAEIARGVRERSKTIIAGSHQKTLSSWDYINTKVGDGTLEWADVNSYVKAHADAMEAASDMGRLGMIVGTAMEPAVGPYVHSIMDPRKAKIIDKQFFAGSERHGGKNAINIISSHMRERSYASLTTAEKNAIFWEMGTKLTGFRPLKELSAKELTGHSLVDRIEAKIFDLPFIRGLRRSGVAGDDDVANLFITNPLLNDYHLIMEAAKQHGMRAAMQSLFDGPMPVDVVDATDVKKITDYELNRGLKGVVRNPDIGKMLETRSVGSYSQDIMDLNRAAAAHEARQRIAAHTKERIAAKVADYPSEHRHLLNAWKEISENSTESALVASTADNVGVVQMKRTARDIRDAKIRLETLEAMREGGVRGKHIGATLEAPGQEMAEKIAANEANLRMTWRATGERTRAEIAGRIKAMNDRLGTLTVPDGLTGEALQVARGRARQLRQALRKGIDEQEALLAGKYKDEASFIKESVPEEIAREKDLLLSEGRKLKDMRIALKEEADTIEEMIDLVTAQEKFRGKSAIDDLRRNRNKDLAAQEMNVEIAALREGAEMGGLAIDRLPPDMKKNILGRPGTKIYFFKPDDWNAVQEFWRKWNHPDDWGQNAIVKALRTMRNVWAPYTAVNGLGLAGRVRDGVQNHLMYEMGGAWTSIGSRFRSYAAADRVARGAMLGIDDVAKKKAFEAGKFTPRVRAPDAPESYSYAELLQFAQNRGINGAASMHGETIVHAGDMMTLAQVKPFKKGELLEKGSVLKGRVGEKQTFVPKAVTDLPSALLPIRKPQDSVYGRMGLHMAQWVDDRSRLAGFFGKLDQGASLDEAADFALKWGYDSRRNMTTLERQRLATFIPFYSWAKFAISRSVETFFKHPGRIAWIDKGRQNFMKSVLPGETEADPDDIEAVLPEWIATSYGVPYKNGAKGPSFFLLGSWLPTGEMQQIVAAISGVMKKGNATPILDYIGAKIHPAIGTAIETAFNHEFYRGKELETFEGAHDEFMGMVVSKRYGMNLLQNFRFLYEIDRQNLLGVSEAQSLRHATAPEDDPSQLTRLMQSSFGIMPRTYPLSVEQATREAKRNEVKHLDKLSGLLKNRAQHPERKASAEDAETLRELLTTGAARLARIEGLGKSFPPDQPAVKKKRNKFGPLTESLTP